MLCKICGGGNIVKTYEGKIRNGGLGKYTSTDVVMWHCEDCGVIWHDKLLDVSDYYESAEYRTSMNETTNAECFYSLHDRENLDKFLWTGTDMFRGKVVADIGSGAGGFLDFIAGAASRIIAVEPSEIYHDTMRGKGFQVYPYMSDAVRAGEAANVVTSFDVIEHVEEPGEFLREVFCLLRRGGAAIIGTPTDAPVMRALMGTEYERKLLFSVQHLWILSERALRLLAEKAGFSDITIKFYQRYGLSNLLAWMKEKKAPGHIQYDFISPAMNAVWRAELERQGLADYIVLYGKK